ncbi:dna polymerase gamma [Moniliophthora roreri MCA 2997]|uniref:Mitochondrial DNA polymerase catalytic subunit n=2 Tax=Moniliophthora roreri TaxID=221103 RepID=V2Y684_MONRO|nr:dna polymerase gamma [Moniliophthora roreri MCA 2997]
MFSDLIPELNRDFAAKRNPLGVQLLSKSLHEQIFKNCSFPPPPKPFVNISLEHLSTHGLDPSQSSTLPPTEFTLPPLQGDDLLQHFHRIGYASSEPYLTLAKQFANSQLPPIPENWDSQPGWTKYYHSSDGSDYSEHVEYPIHDGQPEQLVTFDVETMPKCHQYPVMACAATPNAWYVWISPWLLDPSSASPAHLIPMGPPDVPRIIVGHNVSYDRARILEEYHLHGTKNRFLDTMSLHVAIKGISSHQRPAWMKYRKNKDDEIARRDEATEALLHLKQGVDQVIDQAGLSVEKAQLQQLLDLRKSLETYLPTLQASQAASIASASEEDLASLAPLLDNDTVVEAPSRRWEDLTSANSLVDVAKLHCNIDISKEIRNDFMTATPEEIFADIADYLGYCAGDVDVTHSVYRKVLPGFLSACPHPVSFAGVLTMGSGFLPVNEQWEAYLERAEAVWQGLEKKVRDGLEKLARSAMEAYPVAAPVEDNTANKGWRDDVWLSQLDWTPKVAGKTRGILPPTIVSYFQCKHLQSLIKAFYQSELQFDIVPSPGRALPAWYAIVQSEPLGKKSMERILPLLLQLAFEGVPMSFTPNEKWFYNRTGLDGDIRRLPTARKGTKTGSILYYRHALPLLGNISMTSCDVELAKKISRGEKGEDIKKAVLELARVAYERPASEREQDPWLCQLDWEEVEVDSKGEVKSKSKKAAKPPKPPPVYWPKWFWDLTKPKKDMPPGSLDITIRNRYAPLLLKMSWHGYPLFFSREHGWTFRVPTRPTENFDPAAVASAQEKFRRLTALSFYEPEDDKLAEASLRDGYVFYKLPHKDGDKANVGSPLAKGFLRFATDGVMTSHAGNELKELVDIGVKCSYWISARDRILNQRIEWATVARSYDWDMGFSEDVQPSSPAVAQEQTNLDDGITETSREKKWGIILPQVVTMGTVTRRAIEKTWLTASNAKSNRVGSELKAMVRAPPGYAIVGADVDSEELWISSCMGDAQFGMHGATAIGWMTLEGTKSAGTDLHSKTASILGISRDQAKVFNYSRIYGAGMRHAILLLLQGNSNMAPEEAQKLAENLYASTKGKNTHRSDIFQRKFWFGGSESYLFNKLEEIAMSDNPQTPALGCGVTHALMKDCLPSEFGSDYLPSRINWVVQSSGVDYLHLLIVSMDFLIKKYKIQARYLISVHDELRYLVKEEDKYRAALAMQIANLWTRCMFAYKLGMDDLPLGVAFFSAVDVDHVLRKEVDMPCVTPSQPDPIPPGESLNIGQVLTKTNGGSLWEDGRSMAEPDTQFVGSLEGFMETDCLRHRASNTAFLRAQATQDLNEVKHLAKSVYGKFEDGAKEPGKSRRTGKGRRKAKSAPIGNGDGVDWSETIENLLKSGRELML